MGIMLGHTWAVSILENSILGEAQRRWQLNNQHAERYDDSEDLSKTVDAVLEEAKAALVEWKKENGKRGDLMEQLTEDASRRLKETEFEEGHGTKKKKNEPFFVYWRKKKSQGG